MFHEFVFGDDVATAFHEHYQQINGSGGERYDFCPPHENAFLCVQTKLAEFVQMFSRIVLKA